MAAPQWTESISSRFICGTLLVLFVFVSINGLFLIGIGIKDLFQKRVIGLIPIVVGGVGILLLGAHTSLCSRTLLDPK